MANRFSQKFIFIPKSATGGLSKPQTLEEANEMLTKIQGKKNMCTYIKQTKKCIFHEIKKKSNLC